MELRKSVFAKLPNFCVTSSFPHDIMHDLNELVIPVTVRLVLGHHVGSSSQCSLTLQQFNDTLLRVNW